MQTRHHQASSLHDGCDCCDDGTGQQVSPLCWTLALGAADTMSLPAPDLVPAQGAPCQEQAKEELCWQPGLALRLWAEGNLPPHWQLHPAQCAHPHGAVRAVPCGGACSPPAQRWGCLLIHQVSRKAPRQTLICPALQPHLLLCQGDMHRNRA